MSSVYRWTSGLLLSLLCVSAAPHAFALNDGDMTAPLGAPADPTTEVLYVNGFNVPEASARRTAAALGQQLGRGTRLVWNDLQNPALDWIPLVIEKVVNGDLAVNAATGTLQREIASRAGKGKDTWIVAHSAGSLCVRNAIHELEDAWNALPAAERAQRYHHVRIVLIGGAVFGQENLWGSGWPDGLRVFRITDVSDAVAQFVGDGPWGDDLDEAHFVSNYLPHVTLEAFKLHGRRLIRGQRVLGDVITVADDPRKIAARFRVVPMPKQKSRRTVNQFMPKDWPILTWSVSDHPDPGSVRFMPMRDNPNGSDKAANPSLLADGSHQVVAGWFHYLGRVEGAIPDDGFWITARPATPR